MTDSTYSYINLEYLELMSDGDIDMKKVMLEMLLEELPAEVQKLADFSIEKDMENLSAVSHKLKSTLAFVGNETLDQTNKAIERIARKEEGNPSDLTPMTTNMDKYCELVLTELRQEFAKL
jgi:HPt (histidine-containing phosphotransfer) domain-containing protein